jgi:cell division septum initiation protein DivIVA
MWRDIDSLRKQNESTKKEIESMRRKSKQTETETEQLRSETEILKRQTKSLELIESNDLNALLREATITGKNDSGQSEDQLDLDLLAEKFVALGCDAVDVPFLFDVLELIKRKELSAPRKIILSTPAFQTKTSRRNNSRIKRDRQDQNFIIGPNQIWASYISQATQIHALNTVIEVDSMTRELKLSDCNDQAKVATHQLVDYSITAVLPNTPP